ncbi:class F sortase [Streptomyces sp. ME01-18a]|uniref:class F sortase n=1 Tax=unclassified Streptomyces TaxID=2593676 RepID=UPI0029BAB547|nr:MULTISPECIES: class F sortase [unclassified Streptomyces]MDX3428927.1 class F sortase [Streptomyces sp. ME01-18a]MDX3687273.1 class F sortase [Streptomyces sp. AK04-4c]
MSAPDRPAGTGRLLTGVAWAVLLLGLWLWGRAATAGNSAPTTGDVAAVGRPLGAPLPPAHDPLDGAAPQRVEISSIGIDATVVKRGLDDEGAIEPPPFATPGAVGWYGEGTEPGTEGAALFVGHVDTETEPAVFYGLSTARPGEKIRVSRDDGKVAEFTIDDVQVFTRARFDAQKAYGPREDGRAELRLITCGGTYDHTSHTYTANVVVSAYLTGEKAAERTAEKETGKAGAQSAVSSRS